MTVYPSSAVRIVVLLVLALAVGCAAGAEDGDTGPGRGERSDVGRRPVDAGTTGTRDTGGTRDVSGSDAGASDVGSTDTATDSGVADVPDIPPGCDEDGDGVAAMSCGGTDCDDSDGSVAPGIPELCDFSDNDCSGTVNDGINCEIFAHTAQDLFLVDPFNFTLTPFGSVPNRMYDFDTHPDGTLYGLQGGSIYRYDAGMGSWVTLAGIGVLGSGPNGFAIDNDGTAYVTSGTEVYSVDLDAGTSQRIGNTGYLSSGDCVVNKDGTLYMSAAQTVGNDLLVIIDPVTGSATEVGNIGVRAVYGLTAAWGYMFGFTGEGDLVLIDEVTGAGQVLHRFGGTVFNGSASSPER